MIEDDSFGLPVLGLRSQSTVDEVDALPLDGNRHERLNGILLVTPFPGQPHQAVELNSPSGVLVVRPS